MGCVKRLEASGSGESCVEGIGRVSTSEGTELKELEEAADRVSSFMWITESCRNMAASNRLGTWAALLIAFSTTTAEARLDFELYVFPGRE